MRLSASRLGTWMDCPLQAKFQYVDLLPRSQNAAATFGSCIHKALQVYNDSGNNLEQAINVFKEWWNNPEKYGIEPQVWPKGQSFGGYMKKGIDALTEYHNQVKWEKRDIIGTEVEFLVPFGEYELTGAIDLLDIVGDKKGRKTLRITDYKTNGRAPYVSNLRLNIQFSIYDYASRQEEFWTGASPEFPGVENGAWWWEMVKDMPRQNVWYGLMQKKPFDAGERDDPDYMRLYRAAREIEKALEHNVYVPDISGDTCTFCPYTVPCRLPINPLDYDPDEDT